MSRNGIGLERLACITGLWDAGYTPERIYRIHTTESKVFQANPYIAAAVALELSGKSYKRDPELKARVNGNHNPPAMAAEIVAVAVDLFGEEESAAQQRAIDDLMGMGGVAEIVEKYLAAVPVRG